MTTTNNDLERKLEDFYAQPPPPPGGLVSGRERMLAEAVRLKAQSPSRSFPIGNATQNIKPKRKRKMKLFLAYKIIAAVMAVVVGTTAVGGGVAFASADSLPGDALYPIKLAIEDTRLALTSDPAAQAGLSLAFAAERAQEMQQLIAQDEPVPEDTIDRMIRHTEQVMAHIAQAQPEDVPGLLERVMERTRVQEQVLEQVRASAPEETQTALRQAAEVMKRAYETASAAQGNPERFHKEYQNRYKSTPGPHGKASPSHTPISPNNTHTPVSGQPTTSIDDVTIIAEPTTPVGTLTPGQPQYRHQDQNQNQNKAHTPVGEQYHTNIRDKHRAAQDETPTSESTSEPSPTCTPTPTHTPHPTHTPRPTHPPQPTHTPPHPTHPPQPTHTPNSTHPPKHGGSGSGH